MSETNANSHHHHHQEAFDPFQITENNSSSPDDNNLTFDQSFPNSPTHQVRADQSVDFPEDPGAVIIVEEEQQPPPSSKLNNTEEEDTYSNNDMTPVEEAIKNKIIHQPGDTSFNHHNDVSMIPQNASTVHDSSYVHLSTINNVNNNNNNNNMDEIIRKVYYSLLYCMSYPNQFDSDLFQNVTEEEMDNNDTDGFSINLPPSQVDSNLVFRSLRENLSGSSVDADEQVFLPSLLFAQEAEVVLPQAHTASQLFGVERQTGIELEAASGLDDICALFRRFLRIVPGGDHFDIIDPPGLTIMRISPGGRYRCTAAHRVVWVWMNEFLDFDDENADTIAKYTPETSFTNNNNTVKKEKQQLAVMGDLVTMTIVDVFETDEYGRLLSYCPTFDNRLIQRTQLSTERLKRKSIRMMDRLNTVARSKTAAEVNNQLRMVASRMKDAAVHFKEKLKADENYHQNSNNNEKPCPGSTGKSFDSDGESTKSDKTKGSMKERFFKGLNRSNISSSGSKDTAAAADNKAFEKAMASVAEARGNSSKPSSYEQLSSGNIGTPPRPIRSNKASSSLSPNNRVSYGEL